MDTVKAFREFKKTNKVYEVMFFDMSKYLYLESLFSTLYIEINHSFLKKIFWTK